MTTNPQNRLPSNPTKIKNLLSKVGEELLLDENFVLEIAQLHDGGAGILASFGITQDKVQNARKNSKQVE